MKITHYLPSMSLVCLGLSISMALPAAEEANVKITEQLAEVAVTHDGKAVSIVRNQDKDHTIDPAYAKTSRQCPPFCVTPMQAAEGVVTVGELEVLDYLKQAATGDVVVVDSRTPDWQARGTIPGSINVPWLKISPQDAVAFDSGEVQGRDDILVNLFGASKTDKGLDFSNAKTLVLFCNGNWCGQSLHNIKSLLELGYPANKLKWYRGGMQDWVSLGLTTVK
jgi:rhodanese-related sulfurtransferase